MNTRIKQMQVVLQEKKISAIVVRLPENVLLLSKHWPQNGFCFVYIPQKGEPCLIAPYGEFVNSTDIETQYFGWTRIFDNDPYISVGDILKNLKLRDKIPQNARIAVENDYDFIAPPLCSGEILLPGSTTLAMYEESFDTKNFFSAREIIYPLRTIKTKDEVESLWMCNSIARQGVAFFKRIIRDAGKRRDLRAIDIAADVEAFISKHAASRGGVKFCKSWAQVSTSKQTAKAWFPGMISSADPIKKGDFIMLELATVLNGYWSDYTETAVYGESSKEQRRIIKIVKEAQRIAIDGVRDGMKANAIDSFARYYIKQMGFEENFLHGTGHGTGFAYHETYPILGPFSNDIVEDGMVFSIEPGIYISDFGGVRFESNVIVKNNRAQELGLDD